MPAPLRLEVFERPSEPDAPAWMLPEDLEDLRLSAYERGYVAGWDDAGRQAEAERAKRQAQVAERIEALSFGYHEARAHVLAGLVPLIEAALGQILPAVARASVVPVVIEQLLPLAAVQAGKPLTLCVPQGWHADYAAALEGLVLPPLTVTEDARLDAAQAEILSENPEGTVTRIDLTAALARILSALAALNPRPAEESLRA